MFILVLTGQTAPEVVGRGVVTCTGVEEVFEAAFAMKPKTGDNKIHLLIQWNLSFGTPPFRGHKLWSRKINMFL